LLPLGPGVVGAAGFVQEERDGEVEVAALLRREGWVSCCEAPRAHLRAFSIPRI
jgi:hypothetical protein